LTYSLCFILLVSTFFTLLEPSIKTPLFVNFQQNKMHSQTINILDRDGNLAIDSTTRLYCNIDDVPNHTVDAFVCTEDRRFFEHNGIDTLRIAKATAKNTMSRKFLEGASTITQQLAKNTHLYNQKKISRKINELRLARAIEREYSKREILNMYFDILYFGQNIYGIATAARAFFGKAVQDLTVGESAYLVAIINSPKLYNPYYNRDNLEKRKNLVLNQMVKFGRLSKEQAQIAKEQQVNFLPYNTAFCQTAFVVNEGLKNGTIEFEKNSNTIVTTIDSKMLLKSKKILDALTPNGCHSSIYAVNNDGSIAFLYSTSNANMLQKRRQLGSTIKPLLCYAPALEDCIIAPLTPIKDIKKQFGDYSPSNYGNKYLGDTTISKALATSSNVVAVQILKDLGIDRAKFVASQFGLDFDESDNTLGIALGATTKGFTLPQLVTAYATFPNMGVILSPKISPNQPQNRDTILRSDTAHLINQMLRECVKSGTARRLKELPFAVCAKTGTMGNKSYNTDAYCVAYTAQHTIGIWVGGEEMSNSVTGGTVPTDMMNQVMQELYKNTPPKPLKTSPNVKTYFVDSEAFYQQHKLIAAAQDCLDKDKIKGEFSVFNPPTTQKYIGPYQTQNKTLNRYQDLLDLQIRSVPYYLLQSIKN